MKYTKNILSFALGSAITASLFLTATPAFAAMVGKTIQVATGVNIYVDDQKLIKDRKGNNAEGFIYNGTTYLPLRAVADAVDKTVQWDGKTSSVYLGKHTSTEPAAYLQDVDCLTGREIKTRTLQDNLGNYRTNCTTVGFKNTYLANGKYSAISGTLFYPKNANTGCFGVIQIFGDDKLLYEGRVGYGETPVDFKVDLTGVLNLRVNFIEEDISGTKLDDGLWTNVAVSNLALWY